MRKFTGSKLDLKGMLQSSMENGFKSSHQSPAVQAQEVKKYILEMVVELGDMAEGIKDWKLAERLRSVARPSALEALCSTDLSDV